MLTLYNKLVRDRIPEIIRSEGRTCIITTLRREEYIASLKQKLTEEAQEAARAEPASLLGELADIYEVIDALAAAASIERAEILCEQERKRAERGGFEQRICLLWAE